MAGEHLRDLLSQVRTLLLDFDGPVCSIFAGYPAATIADELRRLITSQGIQVPQAVRTEDDPLQVLRGSDELGGEALAGLIGDALRDREVIATETAEPTQGFAGVLSAAEETGRRLAIVSNNSAAAVEKYLTRGGFVTEFEHISARHNGMRPHLLKPDAHLVTLALTAMHADRHSTALVGDAASDIRAAQAAGIRSIGYANKPGKQAALSEAGADTIITTLDDLSLALRKTPLPPAGECPSLE